MDDKRWSQLHARWLRIIELDFDSYQTSFSEMQIHMKTMINSGISPKETWEFLFYDVNGTVDTMNWKKPTQKELERMGKLNGWLKYD